jgi:MFS family permease
VGADLSMVGLIVASYSIPQLFLRIPIGILFDSITRRKPLIIIGILLASLGALGLGLSYSPWLIFWSRVITGIASSTWVCFIVYFIAFHPQKDAGKSISILNFVLLSAMVLATFSGGFIAQHFGYSVTFLGAAVLGLIALIAFLFTGEPLMIRTEGFSVKTFISIITHRPLILIALMGFLNSYADWSVIFGFLPVYGAKIGASSADLGIITTLSLGASAVASLFVMQLVKWSSASFALMLGAALLGITVLIVPWITDISILKVVMIIGGLGRGFLMTLLMSLSISGIPHQKQATAMSFFQAINALGMVIGPLSSGFIANSFGLNPVFYMAAAISFVLAVIAYLPIVRRLQLS